MSGSHEKLPKAIWVQLGLATLVGAGYLFSEKPAAHAMSDDEPKPIVQAAEKALAPIGKVEIKEEKTASAAKSGKDIYNETCGTCHKSGIANAPKLENKGEWESRLSDGYAALVTSSIKGKGGMPARGGNPDYSDSEMELVVSHMIKEAGIDLVPRSTAGSSSVAAPKQMESKTEAVKEIIEEKTETVTEKVEEVQTEESKTTKKMDEKVEAIKTEAETAIASTVSSVKAVVDHSKGEAIYKSSCFACHDSGVAKSPIKGDKAAWEPRIAAGADALYESAIKGKGAMPAKGGNAGISDDDIKAAVDYMTAESM